MRLKLFTAPFIVAILTSSLIPFYAALNQNVYNDVSAYYIAVFNETLTGTMYGVNTEWVYPAGALIPIMIAGGLGVLLGGHYSAGWVLMVTILNFTATLIAGRQYSLGWKQLLIFSIIPVALTGVFYYRLEGFVIPLTIIAIMLARKYKQLAYILLTVGVLIKIWPIAVIAALWLMSDEKIKDIMKVAGYTLVMLLPSIILGGWNIISSFLIQQNMRGVQVESLYALFLFLQGGVGYHDDNINTYQIVVNPVNGEIISYFSTISILAVLIVAAVLGFTKYWRTPATASEAWLLGNIIIIVLIVFNKVGSTQFTAWLTITLLTMYVYNQSSLFKNQYVTVILAANIFSGLIYPHFYGHLLEAHWVGIALLALKHLALLTLLVYMIVDYVKQAGGNKTKKLENSLV